MKSKDQIVRINQFLEDRLNVKEVYSETEYQGYRSIINRGGGRDQTIEEVPTYQFGKNQRIKEYLIKFAEDVINVL